MLMEPQRLSIATKLASISCSEYAVQVCACIDRLHLDGASEANLAFNWRTLTLSCTLTRLMSRAGLATIAPPGMSLHSSQTALCNIGYAIAKESAMLCTIYRSNIGT